MNQEVARKKLAAAEAAYQKVAPAYDVALSAYYAALAEYRDAVLQNFLYPEGLK